MKRFSQLTAASLLVWGAAVLWLAGTARAQVATMMRPDDAVKAVVEQRLDKNQLLRNDKIQVEANDGTITLTGTVRSLDHVNRAEKLAHQVEDSYLIDNQLTVAPTTLSDQQLTDSVMNQINDYVEYSIFDWVNVQVKDRVVTLNGWVHDSWNREGYERQARKAPGVVQVINDLQELPASFTDDHLRNEVSEMLYDDAFLYRYGYKEIPDIHIIVDHGVVTLMGTVDTKYDADRAGSLVDFGSDAFGVVNDLKYRSLK